MKTGGRGDGGEGLSSTLTRLRAVPSTPDRQGQGDCTEYVLPSSVVLRTNIKRMSQSG